MKPMKRVMMILMAFTLFLQWLLQTLPMHVEVAAVSNPALAAIQQLQKNQQQQITSKKVTALKAPQQDLPLIRNVDSSAAAA